MTIVVTGATGTVGRHLVRVLQERGETVRTFGRRVPGFDGGERLFLACGNVQEQVDFECAVIDAAAAAGVTRVVKLSGPDADESSPMLFEQWHGRIERHLADSGLPSVRLRPKTFLTNLLAFAPAIASTGMVFAPAADARVAFVDPRDVAEVAAVVLTEPGHDGATYELTGPEAITYERVAAALGAGYQSISEEAARPMLPGPVLAIFAAQRAGAMAGVTDTIERLTGRPPRTVDDFARDFSDAFRPVSASAARTPG
jgi:uncharacterized protein YbjT (DUF2867 family)